MPYSKIRKIEQRIVFVLLVVMLACLPFQENMQPAVNGCGISASGARDMRGGYNKIAYLTFDDGPSRNNTPKNLDALKKYGVKATFFVLPKDGLDDIYNRILDEGHVIGNHSYCHDYRNLYCSLDKFTQDLVRARDFIKERFGYTTTLYRFPGGTIGKNAGIIGERIKVLIKNGYRYFDWNVSAGDADWTGRSRSYDVLVNNVLEGADGKDTIIVLMHDSENKTRTAQALPEIIEGLQKMGFTFDVLTNMNKK